MRSGILCIMNPCYTRNNFNDHKLIFREEILNMPTSHPLKLWRADGAATHHLAPHKLETLAIRRSVARAYFWLQQCQGPDGAWHESPKHARHAHNYLARAVGQESSTLPRVRRLWLDKTPTFRPIITTALAISAMLEVGERVDSPELASAASALERSLLHPNSVPPSARSVALSALLRRYRSPRTITQPGPALLKIYNPDAESAAKSTGNGHRIRKTTIGSTDRPVDLEHAIISRITRLLDISVDTIATAPEEKPNPSGMVEMISLLQLIGHARFEQLPNAADDVIEQLGRWIPSMLQTAWATSCEGFMHLNLLIEALCQVKDSMASKLESKIAAWIADGQTSSGGWLGYTGSGGTTSPFKTAAAMLILRNVAPKQFDDQRCRLSVQYLLRRQQADGGWFDPCGQASPRDSFPMPGRIETTSLVLTALEQARKSREADQIDRPDNFRVFNG